MTHAALAGPAPELWERLVAVPASWLGARPRLALWVGRVRWGVLWVSLITLVVTLVVSRVARDSVQAWLSCMLLLVGVYAMARTKTVSWRVVAGVFSVSILWAPVVGWVSLRLSAQVRELMLTEPISSLASPLGSTAAGLVSTGTAVAAFTEESLKLVPVLLIVLLAAGRVRRFAVVDWLLLGFAAGLGFQAFEDMARRLYLATAKPGLFDFLISDEQRAAGMPTYHWWWPFSGGSFQSSGDFSAWYAGHHVFTALLAVAGGLGVAAWRHSRSHSRLRKPPPGSESPPSWSPSRWGWRALAVMLPVGMFWMIAVDHFGFNATAHERRWLDPAHSTVPWPIRWTWSLLGHGEGRAGLLLLLLCGGIVLDAARVRNLPGVSVLPAPPTGPQRWVVSVLVRWPDRSWARARSTLSGAADAVAWAMALVWRDLVVALAAHSRTPSTAAPDVSTVGPPGSAPSGPVSAPSGPGWAERVAALERGRETSVMLRSVRCEEHTVLADLSAPVPAVVRARRTTRLVAVAVLAAVLVVALVFAPRLASHMGTGVWEGTLIEHLGGWLAGILDGIAGWWNQLSPGQQVLVGAGLAALVVLSGGSLGLALGASGVATYGLSHAGGLASLTRDPKAATRSYLSHSTPSSILLDGAEGVLTFLPSNFAGAVAGRGLRNGVKEFMHNLTANTAEGAADAALAAGRTTGAAAELRVGRKVFTDVSTGGAPRVLIPAVQDALDAVPLAKRAPWHGACAEMGCLSHALDAGVNPAGGSIRAVAIGSSNPGHGLPKVICKSCSPVLDSFGVTH